MKLHPLFAAACTLAPLFALPACGPGFSGESDSDSISGTDGSGSGSDSMSGSGIDTGTTTEPLPPQGCSYEGEIYDNGEEFETPDGCLSFRCEEGALNVLEDNLVIVSGDLDLPSQEAVDEQVCLSVVEGSLSISGSAADLTTLAQLSRVDANLEISASEAVSLTGLEGLAEVGGSIIIADNAALTQLSFQVYMSVFGDVTIQNNSALTSLWGAEFIGQCNGCLVVPGGAPSTDGDDAPADSAGVEPGGNAEGGDPPGGDGGADAPAGGGTFYGNILIADNDVLTDISALGNLWFAWADLRFRNNASLTSLAPLQLSEVQGDLEVSDHAAMDTVEVEEFVSFVDVWGETMVCGNLGGVACP